MPRYIAFLSLDTTDYITIKTGYVHIYIEIFIEYIPITCFVAHSKGYDTLIFKQLNNLSYNMLYNTFNMLYTTFVI